MSDINNNTIFSEEEQALLEKSKNLRVTLVDNLIKNADPKDRNYGSTARVANELLTSLDKQITDSATIRVKHQDVQNNEATADLVRQTLINSRKLKNTTGVRNLELDPSLKLDNIVPGQTDINPGQLDPSEFVETDEEEK